jgi:hypothetical protein
VTWSDRDDLLEIVMDHWRLGLSRAGDVVESFSWREVRDLSIRIPYLSPPARRVVDVIQSLGPGAPVPARGIEVAFRAGVKERSWELAAGGVYSWRIQYVLADTLNLMTRDQHYGRLGNPGVLDRLVDEVAPRLGTSARLLMGVDFFGAERWIGGPGAHDGELRRLLAEAGPDTRPQPG